MTKKPFVVNTDHTYLRTHLGLEGFWAALGRDPLASITQIVKSQASKSRATEEAIGDRLARIGEPDLALMPVNPVVDGLARQSQAQGHDVILTSRSAPALAQKLANHHGVGTKYVDGEYIALHDADLTQAFGARGFHYAGHHPADLQIWQSADEAIIVGRPLPKVEARLAAEGHEITHVPHCWKTTDLIKALRPHQYVKNVLLLLPLIAAHNFEPLAFLTVFLAIISFSAAASSIYIVNDLLDLEADRKHATKCNRPFASGAVPIETGMKTFALLAAIAIGLAACLNVTFLGIVLLYMGLSLAYSLKLKRMRWIDIATLAGLYTIRVVAGAAAADVYVTGYMLVFIFPVFITLGCVKRLTELTLATSDERLPGRGYGRRDRSDLLNVAGLGMFGALLMFFLYSFTEHARSLYPTQWLLWVALLPLGGWLFRMVSLGYKGKQDYDPIVFAMRDRHGISLIIFTLTIMFYAAGLFHNRFGF